MAHPEKPSRKRKPNAQTSAPPSLPISPSLAAQATVAPGAIPESGTGTELEALRRTQEEKEVVSIEADGVASKTLASRLGVRNLGLENEPVYDASLAPTGEGLTISDTLNQPTHQINPETGTLSQIVEKFNGVPMTDVPIPRAAAMDDLAPAGNRQAREPAGGALQLSAAEAYALQQQQVVAEDQAIVDAKDALSAPEQIAPAVRTTRLKMTLHSVEPLNSSGHSPLTRCTFGAVYSQNPDDEDKVFGDATPYGSLSYNVRSEIAEGLEVGVPYYVDITKVPS